jgi:hypothetical protein
MTIHPDPRAVVDARHGALRGAVDFAMYSIATSGRHAVDAVGIIRIA